MRVWKRFLSFALLLVCTVLAAGCGQSGKAYAANRAKVTDAHEGQVYIYDGFDWIWMTPVEGLPVSTIQESDISWTGDKPSYSGSEYVSLRGIDVSDHQGEIDWKAVKAAGIDFAVIRVARRGYTEGGLFDDEMFEANINGAYEAGLKIGVYFFSQAITVQEALEEAEMTLRRIEPYRDRISLPVYFDWEKIYDDNDARTAGLAVTTLSDCAVAFCETVKNAGYTPGVYFSRHTGYYGFDLTRLEGCSFWFSLPQAKFPSFYYATDVWQYSFSETIPGISTPCDANLLFQRIE